MRMLRFVVLSLFLVAISVNAQSLKLNTITAKGGVIMPESPWDTGFLVGAEADMGEVFNGFVLVPLVTYWSTGYTYSGTTFDLSLSNIQLGADVHYSLDNVAPGLYAGGGLAFNFLTSEYPVFNYTTFQFDQTGSDTETKLGFAVLAGYNLKLGNMAGVVQGRYNIVDGFDTLELTLGILFDMAK